MPTPLVQAEVLRGRARSLRQLADAIATSEAVDLRMRAGSDTWIGPTAARCLDELTALGRALTRAADDLLVRARALDRHALELETLAAGTGAR